MRQLTLIIYLLLLQVTIKAQDKLPSFGKIDKADLEMKDCSFDPGAEAMILIDYGDIKIDGGRNTGWIGESSYRVRCKVLKEKGISRAAIQLRYQSGSNYENINGVKGISYNLGANGEIETTELEKKSIYTKQINKNITEISFAIPNVRVGSVFEYQFKLTRESYRVIPSWTFQQRIPVRYSAYDVNVPTFFKYTSQTVVRQPLEKKVDDGDNWFIMRNIPALKDEPYSSGREDYLQRIEFQLSQIDVPGYLPQNVLSTWPKLTEELLNSDYFGGEIKKNIRGTADLDASLATTKSNKEKIRTIYNYVQSNMQWDGDYDMFSDGIKSAWDKKNGSMADINFILISLLKDAGIKAKPLLISTKDNGAVNTVYPFINQFNGVMAYVSDGNDVYILNAADKYNPFNLIPYEVVFTNALLVDNNEGGIIEIYGDGKATHTIYFTCSVDAEAKVAGQANISSSGYARNQRMELNNKKKLRDVFENNSGINIKVDSLSVKNETDELLSLDQKAEFNGSLQTSGEYIFLPCNLFTAMEKNPFIEENRVMDIDFSFPRSYLINGTYFLPDNVDVSELPKNTKLIMPDTSIVLSRVVQIDNRTLSFRIKLDVGVFGYSAESYPYVKDFYKKMYAILDERIVLKKK